jgi:type VI secretion system protein ImpE
VSQPAVTELMEAAVAGVRAAPTDASARMKLFRLFVATGQWERASTQLDAASDLNTELGFTAMVYKQALACERFRDDVFTGRRTPVIAGEPPQWLALMFEALRADAAVEGSGAALRSQALEEAQAAPGRLNGEAFEWIADADSRLGPVIECYIDGKYYWVPFDRIERIELPQPEDLLDLAWMSGEITFTSGGNKHVLLPVRYPGSERSDEDDVVMARRTVWTTDVTELGLLDVRSVEFG